MPALSGKFNPQEGVIWKVGFIAWNQEVPNNIDRIHICSALVDTGADVTCISKKVAKELMLEPSGKIDMHSARELSEVNTYDVQPAILFGAMPNLEGNLQGEMMIFDPITAPEFTPHRNYDALIGRDVICKRVFTMSFDGHYTFSF